MTPCHLPKQRCGLVTPLHSNGIPMVIFQQVSASCHTTHIVQEWFEEPGRRVQGVALASEFPRSQSNRASVGGAETESPNHGGSTSQLTGLEGPVLGARYHRAPSEVL